MQTHLNVTDNAASQNAQEILVYKKLFPLWCLFTLSIFSFLTTLGLPYQGEEAVYTLTSLEMWYQKEWFVPFLYGHEYGRPPLYNWGIIPLATWLGWEHMLLAARIVTSLATLGSTFILFFFTESLFRNRTLTLLATCIYLSGDLLLRRGWLAYADPLFSFFVFLAISSLWFGLQNKNKTWIILAVISLFASFLTKAFTGYVFYGCTLLILLWRHPNRSILWSPFSIIMHVFSLVLILLWDYSFSDGSHKENMIFDIVTKFNWDDFFAYGLKLITFPLDIVHRWLPCTALLIYFWIKAYFSKKSTSKESMYSYQTKKITTHTIYASAHNNIKFVFWVFCINYIPYWIAPFARVRYLLPLYPFIAILLAYGVYHLDSKKMKIVIYALWGCLIIKYVMGFWGYSFFEKQHRGSYQAAAVDILNIAGEFPLYSNNVAATGLSVTAHLDILRLPAAPLKRPPDPNNWKDGFVLNYSQTLPNVNDTEIAKVYSFGGSKLYLLCRGEACQEMRVPGPTKQ